MEFQGSQLAGSQVRHWLDSQPEQHLIRDAADADSSTPGNQRESDCTDGNTTAKHWDHYDKNSVVYESVNDAVAPSVCDSDIDYSSSMVDDNDFLAVYEHERIPNPQTVYGQDAITEHVVYGHAAVNEQVVDGQEDLNEHVVSGQDDLNEQVVNGQEDCWNEQDVHDEPFQLNQMEGDDLDVGDDSDDEDGDFLDDEESIEDSGFLDDEDDDFLDDEDDVFLDDEDDFFLDDEDDDSLYDEGDDILYDEDDDSVDDEDDLDADQLREANQALRAVVARLEAERDSLIAALKIQAFIKSTN